MIVENSSSLVVTNSRTPLFLKILPNFYHTIKIITPKDILVR